MERETSLEERLRHDKEKADANKARQLRQGGVSALVEEKPAPKSSAKAKPKTSAKAKPKTTRNRAKATSKKK